MLCNDYLAIFPQVANPGLSDKMIAHKPNMFLKQKKDLRYPHLAYFNYRMVFRSTECNCKTILHVYFLTMQANHDDLTTSCIWNQVLNSEVLAWSSENAFRCQPHFALSCNKYYKMGVKNISLVWEDTLGCTKQTVLSSSNNQLLLQKDALKEYHIDCTILTV